MGSLVESTRATGDSFRWTDWVVFGLSAIVLAVLAINPLQPMIKMTLMIATVVLPQVVHRRSSTWALRLALQGRYDIALWVDRLLSRSEAYGESRAGWILVEAGRYEEGLAFYRQRAFDDAGQPRLLTGDLFFYAMTLGRKEKYAEAQQLLELVVAASPKPSAAYITLADCLLSQNKDLNRACELIEQVLNLPKLSGNSPLEIPGNIAMHAWALACCGREHEAELRLQESLASMNLLTKRDQAALHIVAGIAWKTMGKSQQASTAFRQALALHPLGDIGLRAQKEISTIRSEGTQ